MKKTLIALLLFLTANYSNAQTHGRYTIKSIATNKILEFAKQSENRFISKQLDFILSDLSKSTNTKLWEIGGGAIRHLPSGKYLSYNASLNKLLLTDVWNVRHCSWNVNAASLNRSTIVHSSGLYLGVANATKSPSVVVSVNPCNTTAQNCEALLWDIALVEAYVQVPTYNFGTICPSNLIKGDREFNGNGPQISGKVELQFRNNKTEIWATVFFEAIETGGDVSHTKQTWEKLIYTSPVGKKVKDFVIPTVPSTFFFISIKAEHMLHQIINSEVIYTRFPQRGTNNQPLTVYGNVVHHLEIVGDTGGDDISNDTNCSDDTRINKLTIAPFQIILESL